MIKIPFLDFINIESKSKNIELKTNNPEKIKCVLKGNGSYYSIHQNDKNINLIYRVIKGADRYPNEETCLVNSKDGLVFNNEKKIFKKLGISHNFFVIDKAIDSIIGIGGVYSSAASRVNGISLYKTNNIGEWNIEKYNVILNKSKSLKQSYSTHFDSLNIIVYDYYNKEYKLYARYNRSTGNRHVQISTSKDLINWSKCKSVNFDYNDSNVYVPAVIQYPGSSLFLSFYGQQHGRHKKSTVTSIAFSYDGINFRCIKKHLITPFEGPNRAISSIVEKDDTFIIYVHYFKIKELIAYQLRKDGFCCLYTNTCDTEEHIILKPIVFESNNMKINFETKMNGYIKLIFYDNDEKIIEKTNKISGNYIDYDLKINKKINNQKIKIKILMKNCFIYSISLVTNFKNIEESIKCFSDIPEREKFEYIPPKSNKILTTKKRKKYRTNKIEKYNETNCLTKIQFYYTDIVHEKMSQIKIIPVKHDLVEIKNIDYENYNKKHNYPGYDYTNCGRVIYCNFIDSNNKNVKIKLIKNTGANATASDIKLLTIDGKLKPLKSVGKKIKFYYRDLVNEHMSRTKVINAKRHLSKIKNIVYENYNKEHNIEGYNKNNSGRVVYCNFIDINNNVIKINLVKNSGANATVSDIKIF